jgi:hypothetical protein
MESLAFARFGAVVDRAGNTSSPSMPEQRAVTPTWHWPHPVSPDTHHEHGFKWH